MLKYLQKIQQKRIFKKDDIVAMTDNVRTAESVLSSYQKLNLICKIRRNMYCINNLATGLPDVSKYEIASAISLNSCVAYHTAMEYYGLVHQLWSEVHVLTDIKFTPFEFDRLTYAPHLNKYKIGIIEPRFERGVRVTSLERTVIDCISRIDLAGGYEELLHCFESLMQLNETQLVSILNEYNIPVVWKKVGYVLESINNQVQLSKQFFNLCHKNGGNAVNFLTNPKECTQYVCAWKLYVPKIIKSTFTDEII